MPYEIFLSYSHADSDKYGQNYIDEIKRQIEESIGEDIVFLDAKALKDGDEWNSKIQKCLDQSKVFIYLLSENYLKSEYCTRERIWWAQREMAKGRLNESTLPIFYIQIDTEDPEILRKKNNSLSLQGNADTPWFPAGKEIVAKELVKERLNVARIQELQRKWNNASQSKSSIPPYNLKFVGRLAELRKIRAICNHSGMASDSIPVIHGEAGCGKSEISFAYAHGYASEYPGGRFFIPMENVKSWSSAWLKLGDEAINDPYMPVYKFLGLTEDDHKKSPEDFAKLLSEYMLMHINNTPDIDNKPGKTLILLDNIDCLDLLSEEGLKEIFPTAEIPDKLDIIATTRGTPILDNCSKAIAVPIGNLGEEAALELLRLHCGAAPFNQDPPKYDKTTADAKELLAFLEYHAWSVEIIAGYLGRESKYGTTPQDVLEQLKHNFEINKYHNTSFRTIPDCIEKLLQPTINRIKELELGNEILEIAGAAAMFAPDTVSVNLLKMLWKKRHGEKKCTHKDSWLWAWETLKDYHFLAAENNGISRMHRITHSFFRTYGLTKQQELAANIKDIINEAEESAFSSEEAKAIAGLAHFILDQSWKEDFLRPILEWIKNILLEWYCLEESQSLLTKLEPFSSGSNDFVLKADFLSARGDFYSCSSQYDKALENHKKVLSIRKQSLPENHPAIASSHNNIGSVYHHMGDYEKALESHKKALSIRQQSLPETHPDIAQSHNNIGIVYDDMGDYEKALESHKKALLIRQQSLPKNHPKIATSHNNIGVVYANMGDYEKALESQKKALLLRQQSLPETHPDIASSHNNIGTVYAEMGEYEKALECYKKALSIRQQSLPETHPDIATSHNNIGSVYSNMGDYEKALESHKKALSIRQQSLPETHPDIASSHNNIGFAYHNMGDYEKALESHKKALSIRQQSLPETHPDIATSHNNIGFVYYHMGDYEKALESHKKALSIRQQSLPETHPDIAKSYYNIGSILYDCRQYDHALRAFMEAAKIFIESLGEEHPYTVQCFENIQSVQKKLRWWGWWIKLKRLFKK